jgi:hypothetical protein
MKIIYRQCTTEQLQQTMRGRRCVYHVLDDKYGGWTGFEHFGVIWPFRYFGWRVTCSAIVSIEAYGKARRARFFDNVKDAATELSSLMDLGAFARHAEGS